MTMGNTINGATFVAESRTGATFSVRTELDDTSPSTAHRAPPDSILTITGEDRHGYRSAHRSLARELGYSRSEGRLGMAQLTPDGRVVPIVTTYWLRNA